MTATMKGNRSRVSRKASNGASTGSSADRSAKLSVRLSTGLSNPNRRKTRAPPGDAACLRPPREPNCEPDTSYRELLGDLAWRRLHPEIRERFSKKPRPGRVMCYDGIMHIVELSFMGWLFAQFCRLIGTPLAPQRGYNVPMDIRLEPDQLTGGVRWIRRYHFLRGAVAVQSCKTRSGRQELTEHIGYGLSMRLHLSERCGDLYFTSHAYDLTLAGLRLRIPDWLTPGKTTVSHEQIRDRLFRFTLSVDHPLFGRTIYQDGYFE